MTPTPSPSPSPSVTLPPHLADTLLALLQPTPVLPPSTAALLTPYLLPSPSPSIPHALLLQVSKHARSPALAPLMQARQLNPRDYEMIALLAGVRSISSAVGEPVADDERARMGAARQWRDDRRALSSVLNGLFSVGGVGFAAWYAAGSAGWRDEWKSLIALFAAIVVALSEGALFLIWQDRAEKRKQRLAERKARKDANLLKRLEDKHDRGLPLSLPDENHEAELPATVETPDKESPTPVAEPPASDPQSSPPPAEEDHDTLLASPTPAAPDSSTLRRRLPPMSEPAPDDG